MRVGQADVGVAGGVVALVALGLDDHAAAAVEEERAADQLAGDLVDRAVEEVAPRRSARGGAHARSSTTRALTAASVSRAALDLAAERRRAGAARDPLRLQPAAALQHLVVGVVEVLGALAQLLRGQLGERLAAARPRRGPGRRRSRAPRGRGRPCGPAGRRPRSPPASRRRRRPRAARGRTRSRRASRSVASRQSSIVSIASKSGSLSSCMSLP